MYKTMSIDIGQVTQPRLCAGHHTDTNCLDRDAGQPVWSMLSLQQYQIDGFILQQTETLINQFYI